MTLKLKLSSLATTIPWLMLIALSRSILANNNNRSKLQKLESNQTSETQNLTNRQTSDQDNDCPDQAHWIFIGVLVGLVIGAFLLWLFNCFKISTTVVTEFQSTSGNE